jgi:hypothetical protein
MMRKNRFANQAVAVALVLTLFAAGCATNVHIVSYYPPGNEMYELIGRLFIEVDTSRAGEARGAMKGQAAGNVVEQLSDNVFYVEDPSIQTVNRYIHAAFALDYGRSNAFRIVGTEREADYTLEVIVDEHYASVTADPLRLLLAVLLYLPTLGTSLFFVKVNTIEVENIMTVVLRDRRDREIYSKDFDETYFKRYPIIHSGYYNPTYLRVGLLKRIVADSLEEINALF